MTTHVDESLSQFCFDLLEVNTKDITTLGEALGKCDPKRLLAVLLNTDMGWHLSGDALDSRCGESLIRRITSVLNVMKLLYSQRGDDADHKQDHRTDRLCSEFFQTPMIMPFERFEAMDACGLMCRHIGATLIDLRTLPKTYGMLKNEFDHVFSVAQIQKIKNKLNACEAYDEWSWQKLQQSVQTLSFEAWSNALDMPVWLPETLCEYERYCVLGSVFWAMTYRGFNEDEIQRYRCEDNEAQIDDNWDGECSNEGGTDTKDSSFLCADEVFYDEYLSFGEDFANKMSDIVELLNYNCWIDFMEAVMTLADVRQAA